MGLDMYSYKTKYQPEVSVDFKIPEDQMVEEIYYWRKHPNLHGWMENLYRKKCGSAEDFNCVNVLLTIEDINQLEKDIIGDMLPKTSGFFFGQSYGNEEEKKADLIFIDLAKQAIEEGYAVFYSSWW